MSLLLLILGLLLFVGLVLFHELGHFVAARRNGVDVEEFGLGFPPRAKILKRRKGTIYSLNWLPLGGFVRMKGENDSAKAPGSFGAASLSAKVKILIAGVVMNLLAAFLLFTLGSVIGIPKVLPNQFTVARDTKIVRQDVYVGYVEPESPAAKAGLSVQDKIVAIDHDCGLVSACAATEDSRVTSADDLPKLTEKLAGKSVLVTIKRNGQTKYAYLTLRSKNEVEASKKTDNPKGYLGIAPTEFILQRSTWSSPVVAIGLMGQLTKETMKGLGSAISNLFQGNTSKATEQVSGPVGVFVLLKDGSVLGVEFILFIIAVISLTLAIMNILPIPALDGGRLFVTLLFRGLHKPLTKETEDKIHGIGFMALLVLFFLITVVDVKRFF